jgi:hypothetical protein
MTCEECAERQDDIRETLDAIRVSQTQSQAKIDWIVETVNGLMTGFQNMMSAGGPLQMLKELRGANKKGKANA